MVIYSYSAKAFNHWWLWWPPILVADSYGDWPPRLASDINGWPLFRSDNEARMVEIQLPAIIPTSFWPPAQWRGVKMHVAVLVNFVSWSWLTAELVLGVETGCCMADCWVGVGGGDRLLYGKGESGFKKCYHSNELFEKSIYRNNIETHYSIN